MDGPQRGGQRRGAIRGDNIRHAILV
jgi:hypothetical protein